MSPAEQIHPATKLAILLHAATPDRPESCVMPFIYAATAAAMEIEVEVHFTGCAVRLLVDGVAAALKPGERSGKSVYDHMRQAANQGVRFLGCRLALGEHIGAHEAKIPEFGAPSVPAAAAAPKRAPVAVAPIRPLSVMGIGSWPRPRWMLRAIHDRMEARMPEEEFQAIADDAATQAIEAQLRAGADAVTDGEQRRDSYASFVGGILENCQLIPLTDLLPYVSDPVKFEKELRALDIPAHEVRLPAVFGRIARRKPLALHELDFARSVTGRPVKIALPGPYLLTRTMWMECLSDRAYDTREELAQDIVRVLREELTDLLDAGAALVQFDEPVLSEVVFARAKPDSGGRTFMCGALGEKKPIDEELAFARDLINAVVEGFPRERVALHVCRGNWSPDESVALAGDYRMLLPLFKQVRVGTFMLELATPRAGEIEVLRELPDDCRIGVGVVNQKHERIESVDEILAKAERAIALFGPARITLNPDCGFATFADNPLASAKIAEAKLRAIVEAAARLREKYLV